MEVLESEIKGELHSINRAKEIVENQVIAENPEEPSNRAVETREANFSFLGTSGSTNDYSFSYEVLHHECLVYEISRQLAIHDFQDLREDFPRTSLLRRSPLMMS